MSESISQRAEALVAEVESVLRRDLAALEEREQAFVSQCAQQAAHAEPNYTLPDFPDLQEAFYRQLEGECRLLEKALNAWLAKADNLLNHIRATLQP
jgi:hypothetical protein